MSEPRLRQPLSLQFRLLSAASVSLVLFLLLTGVALDSAFRQSALTAMQERLQGYFYGFLAGTDITVTGRLIPPEQSPEPRFDRPGSGLYAAMRGNGVQWDSPSGAGRTVPFRDDLAPGEVEFNGPLETEVGAVYMLSRGVAFERADGGEAVVTVSIAEQEASLDRQLRAFRRTLWRWLGGVVLIVLLVQAAVLRLGLVPLARLGRQLSAIEAGEAQAIEGRYPSELSHLAATLNSVLKAERDNLKRYRKTLGDLAHSLKTPLAVVRSQVENEAGDQPSRQAVLDQVRRMDDIIAYQLQRAATAGHATFAAPLPLADRAEEIVQALEKVHAARGVLCEFDIHPQARFHGDHGDLMELLGNLLENAFKWSRRQVMLTAKPLTRAGSRRPGLLLVIEDDGSGIPDDQIARLLQRGQRGDERISGHGIGLSIVSDIVQSYDAELSVDRSDLGGARFSVRFPPMG